MNPHPYFFIIIFIGLAVDKSLFAPTERFMHQRWGTAQE